jgi:hypothetical protein
MRYFAPPERGLNFNTFGSINISPLWGGERSFPDIKNIFLVR